ncbi:hypothetical protein M885DRAFT_610506 [Pelagophyceae sp. CCMP2097]|nr:hypothetical protein M885DRAFT_610506 [Pelagophyceae sp. CCMP2097]
MRATWLAWALLLVAPNRAFAAPPRNASTGGNASFEGSRGCASLRHAKWFVETPQGGGAQCRFEWPRACGALRHFGGGGDVAQVLSATHLLILGNSVTRMLAITLHELLQRPDGARAVDAVRVGAHTLPDRDDRLWPWHGFASVLFDLRPRPQNSAMPARPMCAEKGGEFNHEAWMHLDYCCLQNNAAAALGPRESAKARDATLISFAFSFTPSEPQILDALRGWAAVNETKNDCGERFAPEFVLLQLTHGLLPELVDVLDAVNATRNSRPGARETTFLVLTQTEVVVTKGDAFSAQFHASHADLVAYEAAAELVAAQYDGVVLVPVSAGTVAGMEAGALRHERGNGWHFLDAGRYYLAHMVLNAMRLVRARRRIDRPNADAQRAERRKRGPDPADA